jgi:cysteine desulfuration protein SufE
VFLADKLDRTVADFAVFEDPQERLTAIVDRAKRAAPLPASERIDANRVHGCVSVVWLVSELREARCYFRGDAESPIVRGLVVFLCDFFNGAPAAEVASTTLNPLDALDVIRNLSPTRRNGLAAAYETIRAAGRAFQGEPVRPGA